MNAWFVNPPGRWDEALIIKALRGQLWNTPAFTEYLERPDQCDVAVVSHIPQCEPGEPRLIIHTSDESHQWQTPRGVRTWMEYATPEHQGDRNILIGCPEDTRELMPARKPLSERRLDWAFSGQVNHQSRYELAEQLKKMKGGEFYLAQGFNNGIPRETHLKLLTESRVAPCPSGTVHPDSFRLYEALEAGCVPVLSRHPFWDEFNVPFPMVDNWNQLPALVATQEQANRAQSWWIRQKRDFAVNLVNDAGVKVDSPVTAIVTTSPIPSHPQTRIIEETISSIRKYLDCEIIIAADGIHSHQEHRRADYEEFKRRLIDQCNYQWKAVLPIIFPNHNHQMAMVRESLRLVRTPFVLMCEHDTPLLGEIPFNYFYQMMEWSHINSIRLYHLPQIPEEVRYMFGTTTGNLAKTFQFSSRPYLAKTGWLKHLLDEHFDPEERVFIEPRLESIYRHGGWEQWNGMWVYAPENMQRSTHSDGRQGEPNVPIEETRYF